MGMGVPLLVKSTCSWIMKTTYMSLNWAHLLGKRHWGVGLLTFRSYVSPVSGITEKNTEIWVTGMSMKVISKIEMSKGFFRMRSGMITTSIFPYIACDDQERLKRRLASMFVHSQMVI